LIDRTSPQAKKKLIEKLSKQEAVWKWKVEIPKEKIWDSRYKIEGKSSYDKRQYTHEWLDGSNTRVHYMQNPQNWNIKDVKVKGTSHPSNYKK
jgi:hypothetical protein